MKDKSTGDLVCLTSESLAPIKRKWSTEQDGIYDKHVEIWYNGNWVPAFLKDVQPGDFVLILDMHLNPGKCFLAKSELKRLPARIDFRGQSIPPMFIMDGLEIVQAPIVELKDIPLIETERKQIGFE